MGEKSFCLPEVSELQGHGWSIFFDGEQIACVGVSRAVGDARDAGGCVDFGGDTAGEVVGAAWNWAGCRERIFF